MESATHPHRRRRSGPGPGGQEVRPSMRVAAWFDREQSGWEETAKRSVRRTDRWVGWTRILLFATIGMITTSCPGPVRDLWETVFGDEDRWSPGLVVEDESRSGTDPTRKHGSCGGWSPSTATTRCGSGTSDQTRRCVFLPSHCRSGPFSRRAPRGVSSAGCLDDVRPDPDRSYAGRRRGFEVDDLPAYRPRTRSPALLGSHADW